jgi:hypothetical protein
MTREYSIQMWITRPDGAREEVSVQSTRVLVGSGAHCDIRFAEPGIAREHLLFEIRGEELYALAKHLDPAPLLRGLPLFQTKIEATDEIAVGRGRIRAKIVWDVARERVLDKRRRASSLVLVFALVFLPVIAWAALRSQREAPIGPAPKNVPALFGEGAKNCMAPTPAQADVLARRLRARAVLLREQSPFDAADGIAAVEHFEKAGACFRVANLPNEAADAAAAARTLRQDLTSAYAAQRVKLEHALDVGDDETALREARVLGKLLAGKSEPYVDWLRLVQQRLTPAAPTEDWSPFHIATN